MELDFLRRCFHQVEEQRKLQALDTRNSSVRISKKEIELASPITLGRLCQLAQVSRAGFYRWRDRPPAGDSDIDLRDEIQQIALQWPCYGSRRVTRELHQRGWQANHKRVRRLMREDNLLS